MDYKELIELLKGWHEQFIFDQHDICAVRCDRFCKNGTEDCIILKASDAIETLLAERDAAVDDLKGRCDICKHRRVCIFDEQHRIGCANSKRGHWQWRGPQKERQ